MWWLVLVTLVACSEPEITKIQGPFENRKQCLSAVGELEYHKGPPSPGSKYECHMF